MMIEGNLMGVARLLSPKYTKKYKNFRSVYQKIQQNAKTKNNRLLYRIECNVRGRIAPSPSIYAGCGAIALREGGFQSRSGSGTITNKCNEFFYQRVHGKETRKHTKKYKKFRWIWGQLKKNRFENRIWAK